MTKIFLTLLSLLIFSCTINAQATHDSKSGQTTEATTPANEAIWLKETEFDFGKIPQGKPVTHVFEVKNIGTDSLRIINVAASCGCTTPVWERNTAVAPGATTNINVGYNAAAPGTFTKTITINYNDTQSKVITIRGEVWATPANSAPENKALEELKN